MANNATIAGIPVYRAVMGDDECGVLRISLVDDPAVMSNFVAFDADKPLMLYKVQDDEKRLVLGVVMRCDFPIYRRSERMGEFYIMYKADTIREMAEKYLVENRQNLVNLMHEDGTDVEGVHMVQYFIKGDGLAPDGFDEISDGSLFAEFHVTNDEVWQAIKDGTYKGFSLEGIFQLEPETDKDYVAEAVEDLDGKFRNQNNKKKMKLKGLLARIAKAIVDFGNISTDKGILAWDGEDDLKAGDRVYIEDADGNREPAGDGEYRTDDRKVIVVEDGVVAEIKDDEAQVASEFIETDKGKLEWDDESRDLQAGDAVYIRDENGEKVPAPDGDYTTSDGKVIKVADGKVTEIVDTSAEVAAKKANRMEAALSKVMKFAESFEEEKTRKIMDALFGQVPEDVYLYIIEAGDDFVVYNLYDDYDWIGKYYRAAVSWNEDGTASIGESVEVKYMIVPIDFPDPFDGAPKEDEEMARLRKENEELRAQVTELERQPKGAAAHDEVLEGQISTGDKGLDRLARIARA